MITLLLALLLQPPPQSATLDFGGTKVKVTVELVTAPTPPPPPAVKRALRQSDFRYLGRIAIQNYGSTHWGQGFTLRKVGSEQRFLTLGFKGNVPVYPQYRLSEFRLPADFATEAVHVRSWENIWPGIEGVGGQGNNVGLWYDQEKERLWTTHCSDYSVHPLNESAITIRTLNDDGAVTLKGSWVCQDIGAARTYGGATKLPDGRYAVGWGGYTSLMDQGGKCSLGPAAFAIPDPEQFASGFIGKTVLMDHSSGARGIRNGDLTDFYDGRDARQNPTTAPTEPPNPPAPTPGDGLAYWAWGDACRAGAWIETADAEGLVLCPTFGAGKVWYGGSTLHCDRCNYELQVYPLASMTGGNVKPASRWLIDLPGRGHRTNYGAWQGAAGMAYDAATKRLYIYSPGAPLEYACYIFCFQVGP